MGGLTYLVGNPTHPCALHLADGNGKSSIVPYQSTSPLDLIPRTWLGRVLVSLGALVVLVLGFFFLTVALAIGAVVAFVIFVRVLWLMHRVRRAGERRKTKGTIEVEYTVNEEREQDAHRLNRPGDER
jgi:hypothetical protein